MRITRLVFPMIALLLFTTTVSMVPAQAQGRQLHINKAIYGKNGQGMDVTNHLRSLIQNNSLDVKVNNKNMGGDPNTGADKSVKVEYTYQGHTSTRVVKEGDRLKLP
jgi:DnaJ-like protein C11, C-terminal